MAARVSTSRAAPWRGALGRGAAVRRRVGARHPAPGCSSTITASACFALLALAASTRCPTAAAPSRPGRVGLEPPSPKSWDLEPAAVRALACRAPGFSPAAEASRDPGAAHSARSTLLVPGLRTQFLPNSPESDSHALLDCSPRSRAPRGQAPCSPPFRSGSPGAGLPTRGKAGLRGVRA